MPLGNDGRASRRPMPRQLDISSWDAESSSSPRDGDRFRSASAVSKEADDFKPREPPSRFETFSEYRPRHPFTSDESQQLEGRAPRSSGFDVSSFSSERSTMRGSTLDTAFTSVSSTMHIPSRGSSTQWRDQGSRHDNQREVDDAARGSRYDSTTWNRQDEPWTSDRSSRSNAPALCERESHYTASSAYDEAAESFTSRTSFSSRISDNPLQSNLKADSIREAESPVHSHREQTARASSHDKKEVTRDAPELRASPFVSSFENQQEPHSPTNSETSVPPSSPDSDRDSITQMIRDRYPKPSIPSPVSSDRSTGRRMRASSPCSSVSTSRTTTSRTKPPASLQTPAQSAMSDLREDLYAFRKQMREVFIRVEDMVDVHRSLFKSDPSTGSPVWNGDLQREAEQLSSEAFEQLAGLRKHFSRLAKDFARSERPSDEWTDRGRRQKTRPATTTTVSSLGTLTQQQEASDDEDSSVKGSDVPEYASDNGLDDASCIVERQGRQDSPDSSQDNAPESVRSSAPTFLSSQLQSRWEDDDISARTSARERSAILVSDASSSLPDQCNGVDKSSIFQDFDARMEEIRCSLNAIAGGKKPRVAAPPPRNFTRGAAGSPMMDAMSTRATLREASRISGHLSEDSDGHGDGNGEPRQGGREAELRRLLQQLNHLNASNDDD